MPDPLNRETAESEITEAANIIRDVLQCGVEPSWLWKRNRYSIMAALADLEIAASSFAFDEPYGGEETDV